MLMITKYNIYIAKLNWLSSLQIHTIIKRKSKRGENKFNALKHNILNLPNYIFILNRMTKHNRSIISNKWFTKLKFINV